MSGGAPPTPDDFSGWGGPGSVPKLDPGAQTPSTPTGLMGRLKNFGKISKKSLNETSSPVLGPTATLHIGAVISDSEVSNSECLLLMRLSYLYILSSGACYTRTTHNQNGTTSCTSQSLVTAIVG